MNPLSRRTFLASAPGAVLAPDLRSAADPPARCLQVAAVYSVLWHRSHPQQFLENFL
jgi:hypothetical protein